MAKVSAVSDASTLEMPPIASVEAPARQTRVSNVLIRALVEVAQRRGVAPEQLLGPSAEAILAEPADGRVTLAEYEALIARATQLARDPALALHCTLMASESSFGLMSPLVSHAATLRQAIELVTQFHGLIMEDVSIQLSERMGTAQLRFKLYVPVARSVVEFIVAGLARMLHAFGCEIHAVRLGYARPAHYHAYAAAFGGRERFGQAFTAIEFSAHALDRPHMHRQADLQALMRSQAERSLERLSRPLTCAERVRALMDSRPIRQVPDMGVAARELGISVRSLRRRLEEEGTSYRELAQSALYAAACSMLRNPELTLQSIAHSLGFADSSTFHRAFRRWSGVTPAAHRLQFHGHTQVDSNHRPAT